MECAVQRTLGATEECPGETCPFWEGAGCFLERRLGSELKQHEFAVWLVAMRRYLESARLVDRAIA